MNSANIPEESYLRVLRRKCRAQYPPYPTKTVSRHWLPDLEHAYRNARITQPMTCPHREGDLRASPVVDGVVTCPLHGLSWDLRTGRLRRMTPERENG